MLSTQNLNLPGICKLQPHSIGLPQVVAKGPELYQLFLLDSLAKSYPWFHTNLLKLSAMVEAELSSLENDIFKVEAILKTKLSLKPRKSDVEGL